MQNHFGIQNLWMVKNLSLKFKRIPLAMRLLVLFFACAMNFAHASDTYAQTSRITIEVTNQTVEYVLEQIKAKTGLDYFCNNAHVNLNRKVSISLNNGSVDEVLNQVIEGTNVTYSIVDDKIIFSVKESAAKQSSDLLVKGKVVDSKGEPVIGAAILEKGTTNGTVTDYDSNFTLTLNSEKAELQISYIGYKTQSLKAQFGKPMSISLAEDTEILDEVVVVGYGTQKKVNLSGAVEAISGATLQDRSVNNVGTMLQGLVPNLNISMSGGQINQTPSFNVRGMTTITQGGAPLILVDGVPMSEADFSRMNSADIESISVLKDASSAAIYGARAAFGVILVTTQKGTNEKMKFTFNNTVSIRTLGRMPEIVKDPYIQASYKDIMGAPWYNLYSDEELDYAKKRQLNPSLSPIIVSSKDPNRYTYLGATDWFHELYNNTGLSNQHSISMSGATKKTSYYLGRALKK